MNTINVLCVRIMSRIVLSAATLCLLFPASSASAEAAAKKGDIVVTVAERIPLMDGRVARLTLGRGEKLLVIDVRGPWIGVKTQGRTPNVTGWVRSHQVESSQPTHRSQDSGAEQAWIDKGNAFIEKGMASATRVISSLTAEDGSMIWLAFPQRVKADNNSLTEAVRCFDKVIEINAANSTAWGNKGFALKYMGQIEAAINCFDKAIKFAPQDASSSWNSKAFALRELNRLDEANVCFEEAIKIAPDESEKAGYFFSMGLVHVELKKFDAARKAFQEAARRGHSGAKDELEQLERQ